MFSVKQKVDVWAATIEDRPGGVGEKLEALAKAGADLQFILARRLHEEPGRGVLYVTPLRDERETAAAEQAGFHRTTHMHSLRLEGPDEPGVGLLLTKALAAEGINLRGLSVISLNGQLVAYLTFDTQQDVERTVTRLDRPL